MKYLLIAVVLTSINGGKVHVVSQHDSISSCHMALTQASFKQETHHMFCMITAEGVDWQMK